MGRNRMDDCYYNRKFMKEIKEITSHARSGEYCMAAIDIGNFRLFNKIYGRRAGDELLDSIYDELCNIAKRSGTTSGYYGADNFCILLPDSDNSVSNLNEVIIKILKGWNDTVAFYPLIGVYSIDDNSVMPEIMYDRATMALSHSMHDGYGHICRYSQDMEDNLQKEVLLLSDIKTGLENGEFIFYVQPQCNITSGKIVGAEALVRWKKKDGSIVSPGVFVPVLERNGMIDQIDRYIWESVCRWISEWRGMGYTAVPISINVSRIDILNMDVPQYLFKLLDKYNVPENLVKVEITESAYTENNDRIIYTVNSLRDRGFKVMMDDFGCGYSSLNMLKDIPVDVLKLDMRFLDISESEEEKGINILESVVNMARLLRLPIVVEGVETEKQEKFVQSLGCRYTQGYYYYKPMPVEKFEELLIDERHIDRQDLFYKQVEPLHIREFIDSNFISDSMLNNILGPVAFYEMHEHQIEITRVNEQYFRLAGSASGRANSYGKKFWNHVLADDRALIYSIFETAYENPTEGADGVIRFIRMDGTIIQVYVKVFFMKEKDGYRQFFSSLTDVSFLETGKTSAIRENNFVRDTDAAVFGADKYYADLPVGFSIDRIIEGTDGTAADFEIVYANNVMERMCGKNYEQLRILALHNFEDNKAQVLSNMYDVAYKGERREFSLYSHISNRYLNFMFYQYQYGYVGCILTNVTNEYIADKALNSIMSSFREVYYIHLDDNYCQMLYPDINRVQERGNYEETVNRHFYNGKIMNSDEENIRRFLSLDNMRKILISQDTAEMTYVRVDEHNNKEWCLTSVIVSTRKEDGSPESVIMVIRSVENLYNEARDKRASYMAETLATMSDGFLIYNADETEKILYASPGVLRMYGCTTIEEFRECIGTSFKDMVYEDDLERIEWEIEDQIKHSQRRLDYIKYRIRRKDGSIRWIDDCGHKEKQLDECGGAVYYVFISDITDSMSEAEKKQIIVKNKYYHTPDKTDDETTEN